MKLNLLAKAVSGVALAAAVTVPAHAAYVVLDGWELVTPLSDTKNIGHLVLGGGGAQITQEINGSGNAFVNSRFAETGSIFTLTYVPENSVGAGDSGPVGIIGFGAGNSGGPEQLKIAFSAVTGHVTSLNSGGGYQYVFDSGTFTIGNAANGNQYTGGSLVGIGGNAANTTPVAKALDNFATVTVDAGPAALATGSDAYYADDIAYVSVTLCAPGTSTCQTIDHVQIDTGSVGLRLLRSALAPALADALPQEKDSSANPVGECYGYVDGYAFGSVREADFAIGGEKVAAMPFQLIGDTDRFATVPSECSSGGGNQLDGVKSFGANGIIGIGPTPTDCGSYCTGGGYSGAIYYDCPATGCDTIISRAANTVAPFQQLPNPVAAMATDNNGSILSLPAVGGSGAASLTGTLTFGIGTQTNNGLGSATPLTTSADGLLSVTYQGQTLDSSFLDSGSNAYFFTDTSLTRCSDTDLTGFYCPASPMTLSPVITGRNSVSANGDFTLYNAKDQFSTGNSAVPGIGADPTAIDSLDPYPASFDFGLPFFLGRKVYTAIAGRTVGGTAGPFVAF